MFGDRRPRVAVASVLVVAAWWSTIGPVGLGGPATFVIVEGRSMEPTLRSGDLVLARATSQHRVGDIVVFTTSDGRSHVMHRLVAGDAVDGWMTRGDGNGRDDPWSLPDELILGRQLLVVPRGGSALAWTRAHPTGFIALVGALAALLGIAGPRRPRPEPLHPDLREALANSVRGTRRAGRPLVELGLLVAAGVAAATGLVALVALASVRMVASAAGASILLLVVVSGATAWWMKLRLADGYGVAEPQASRSILSDLVWCCDALPPVADCVEHPSASALRAVADVTTGHVLWERRDLGDGGIEDRYLTIDAQGLGHRWTVRETVRGSDEERASGLLAALRSAVLSSAASRRRAGAATTIVLVALAGASLLTTVPASASTASSGELRVRVAPLVIDTRVVLSLVWERPPDLDPGPER
jgi:signal peptidase